MAHDSSTHPGVAPALLKHVTGDDPPVRGKPAWDTDHELIRGAAAGSASSQRELLRRALPLVRRVARYLLGHSPDVEDAVQTTLLAVLAAAERFEGRASLETWVTRIATRTTIRLARKQRTLVPSEAIEEMVSEQRQSSTADALPRRIWTYLEQLPEPQRVALVLRYGLEYSIEDIADATESSANTVKYRLKEALAKLRRLIRQDLAIRGGGDEG